MIIVLTGASSSGKSLIEKKLAEEYTKQTGVEVTVVTAANNQYESTLAAEISGSAAPTLFQINGPVGYDTWSDYCYDLSGTKLYDMLSDKSLAIKDGDGVYGIPYAVEGYGIIYNDEIMQKYFALEGKSTDVNSIEDINNFDKLKAVVEDMQDNKDNCNNIFKSKDIAERLFVASRSVSGAMKKLITEGFVKKVGTDPVVYSLTDKGASKEIIFDN